MSLELTDAILLFCAGAGAGILNTVAGGGSFISFPALVLTGLPEIAANATTTVAALPGYLAGAAGFRRELLQLDRAILIRLTLACMAGGAVGSGLLLIASNNVFAVLVPFLLLFATAVFAWGDQIRTAAARYRRSVAPFGVGTLMAVAIYGGFFNGGLGIVLLALFALWGMDNLHLMNGLKSWISFAMSCVSLVVFSGSGLVHWPSAFVMMGGCILGGYAGAPLARRLPIVLLRKVIIVIGSVLTVVFMVKLGFEA